MAFAKHIAGRAGAQHGGHSEVLSSLMNKRTPLQELATSSVPCFNS